MSRHLLFASLAAAALVPSLAFADQTCEQQEANRRAATVGGAVVGGTIGAAVAGRDDRVAGAVIGGTIGAIIGNQAGRSDEPCVPAYGYYDRNGQWHAYNVNNDGARGYYDRDGRFVSGTPNGYYDNQGRWVSTTGGGYYDNQRRYIPASVNGYYDENGNWISGAQAGYYNNRGQWVPGATTGWYDSNGRWQPGQGPGRRDANGYWIADPAPGYYDRNGRWHPGPAQGYYDSRGVWISTGMSSGGGYGNNTGLADFYTRANNLESLINQAANDRALSRRQSNDARYELNAIRQAERTYRSDNYLSDREARTLNDRLRRLEDRVRAQIGSRGGY